MEPKSSASLNSELPIRSSESVSDRTKANSSRHTSSGEAAAGAARYKLMSPARLSISRSAHATTPPELSPTSFLGSPRLLSNTKVEPSPTTGSFLKRQMMHNSIILTKCQNNSNSSSPDKSDEQTGYFEFQPSPRPFLGAAGVNHQHEEIVQVHFHSQAQSLASTPLIRGELALSSGKLVTSETNPSGEVGSEESNQNGYPGVSIQAAQSDHEGPPTIMAEKLCDDGYNWRKYGQKHVKGSEFPRSYYKCTHPNCEVRKLFESSPEGHITEITYKGMHDHPKPQPCRLNADSMMHVQEANVASFTGETSSHVYTLNSNLLEPSGTPQLSLVATNEDSVGGAASLLNRMHNEVDEGDPFSKRRKMGIEGLDVTAVIRPIREPRVVVQTLSELDVLDDGYRWRKYGQKVVRGNPNPRSYYKCTNSGCPVRKHVERASHDPKAVITTYEGKHNHDVPTARASSHDMVGSPAPAGSSRTGAKEGKKISLDLGVGISSAAAEVRSTEPQDTLHPELIRNRIHLIHSNSKVMQLTPVSSYNGAQNGGTADQCVTMENLNGDNGADIPPLNRSYLYLGRVLTGSYTCLPHHRLN